MALAVVRKHQLFGALHASDTFTACRCVDKRARGIVFRIDQHYAKQLRNYPRRKLMDIWITRCRMALLQVYWERGGGNGQVGSK